MADGDQRKPGLALRLPPLPDGRTLALLAVVTLLGFALRVWGMGWGLPDARHPQSTYHPDEVINLGAVLNTDLLRGDFDTEFYSYGTLYFYLVGAAHIIGRGYGFIPTTRSHAPMEDAAREFAALFATGRAVSVLLGTLTILAVFALGSRLFGKRVGLGAALLYAVAPLAVVHAHFLTVDVAATFFVTLALLASARLFDLLTLKNAAWAGVCVGLAAATKYNAGLVLAAPVTVLFARNGVGARFIAPDSAPDAASEEGEGAAEREGAINRAPTGGLLLALVTATACAFLAACPGPLLNWDAFWNGTYSGSGVRYELFEHSRQGHGELFVNTGPGWWYHLRISLPFGLGVPLMLLSLWGVVEALRRRERRDWPPLAFFLVTFGLAGLSSVRFARYLLPLFPVLCLWAARAALRPRPEAFARRVGLSLGGAAGLLTLLYTSGLVNAMAAPDPRDRAADYIEKNSKPDVSYAFAKVPWFFSPPLLPGFGAVSPAVRADAAAMVKRLADFRIPRSEWDTSVLNPPPDYAIVSNFETMHALRLGDERARRWLDSIPANYRRVEFAPPPVPLLPRLGPLIPDDVLYVLPAVTVYTKR